MKLLMNKLQFEEQLISLDRIITMVISGCVRKQTTKLS